MVAAAGQLMLDCFTDYGPWVITNAYDPAVCALMDNHYSRVKRFSNKVGRPGRNLILRTPLGDSMWIAWQTQHPRMDGYEAWEITAFRNESSELSSQLIRWAIFAMISEWGEAPRDGIITYVNATKVESKNPGFCFKKAEFNRIGTSKKGLLLFQTHVNKFLEYEHLEAIKNATTAWDYLRLYEESSSMHDVIECYKWLKSELEVLYQIEALIREKKVEPWDTYMSPDDLDFTLDYYEDMLMISEE